MSYAAAQNTLAGEYRGEGKPLFWLAFKTGILTILTLGIYRFWAKSRIRRYIWSSITPGNDPMEYTGTGLEKFIGFLIAIVILAVYLGIFQILLTFVGFSVFDFLGQDLPPQQLELMLQLSINLSILALLPLIFVAVYRGRRYRLSRTRWRGLRFGMEKGAFGYMLRAIGYLILTISTVGILLPLQTFKLEKYMADRTWYGTAQMRQDGKWTMLYPAMKHVLIALLFFVGAVVSAGFEMPNVAAALGVVGYVWIIVGLAHYRVQSFAIMARHKVLDDAITFEANPSTWQVVKIYILGALAIVAAVFAAIIPFIALFWGSGMFVAGDDPFANVGVFGAVGVAVVVLYLLLLIMIAALAAALISQPILRHFIVTAKLKNADHIETIRQRSRDQMPDAEGFADALDVGGAF